MVQSNHKTLTVENPFNNLHILRCMSFLTLAPRGLDIVLDRGGERARQILEHFAKDTSVSDSVMKRMKHLGAKPGLSEGEVDATLQTSRSRLLIALPIVIVIILVAIAIIFNWEQIMDYIYAPGSMYDTVRPKDFDGDMRGS